MSRKTSIESYRLIQEKGLLSKRRWEVYDVLFRHGPLTANEAFNILKKEKYKNLNFDSNTRARFTELRESGAIEEVGEATCSITKMTVILWDVTASLPIKINKPNKIKCDHCSGRGYYFEANKESL